MIEMSESQKELKVQQGIRQVEDRLVMAIERALNDRSSYGDLEESQFRNLVRVADTTESAEVVKNFIRYQVGRDRKWGRGKNALAAKIIQDIDDMIKVEAQGIAKKSKVEHFQPIWLELIRRYLGYGVRHLTYLRKGEL